MHKPIKFIYAALVITIIGSGITFAVLRQAQKQLSIGVDHTLTKKEISKEVDDLRQQKENAPDIRDYIVENPHDPEQTLAISGNTAVFNQMSPENIKAIQTLENDPSKHTIEEAEYEAPAHIFLRNKIKVIDTDKIYLSFTNPSGTTSYIDMDTDTQVDMHGGKETPSLLLFLFKDGKMPTIASMVDVDTDYAAYYGVPKSKLSYDCKSRNAPFTVGTSVSLTGPSVKTFNVKLGSSNEDAMLVECLTHTKGLYITDMQGVVTEVLVPTKNQGSDFDIRDVFTKNNRFSFVEFDGEAVYYSESTFGFDDHSKLDICHPKGILYGYSFPTHTLFSESATTDVECEGSYDIKFIKSYSDNIESASKKIRAKLESMTASYIKDAKSQFRPCEGC